MISKIAEYEDKINMLEVALEEKTKLVNHFINLLNSIPDPVFMKDENLLWIYGNPVILNLYNIDPNNYIGKAEDELLPMEFAQSCMKSDENARDSKQIKKSEERARDQDDKLHYYEVFKVPFYENNSFKGLIGVGRDITETKEKTIELQNALETQKQLNQQAKLMQMGEMLENIAHQWRQPLSIITTISSSAITKNDFGLELSKDDIISDMQNILKYSDYMNQTINDFRDFLENKQEKSLFNVSETIKQSLSLVKGDLTKNNIEIFKTLDTQITSFGKRNELMQVIINILNNAKDAMGENNISNKVISINLFTQNEKIIIEISDNGKGIPENILPNIFEPHFTTKKDMGTGIGLYMSKQIINNSFNGELSVENINDGAKFTIAF